MDNAEFGDKGPIYFNTLLGTEQYPVCPVYLAPWPILER